MSNWKKIFLMINVVGLFTICNVLYFKHVANKADRYIRQIEYIHSKIETASNDEIQTFNQLNDLIKSYGYESINIDQSLFDGETNLNLRVKSNEFIRECKEKMSSDYPSIYQELINSDEYKRYVAMILNFENYIRYYKDSYNNAIDKYYKLYEGNRILLNILKYDDIVFTKLN